MRFTAAMFLYFSNLCSKHEDQGSTYESETNQLFFMQSTRTSFCCVTYRSSVGATGEGLVAAALCAAAALTNRYETYTEVRIERRGDEEEQIRRRRVLYVHVIIFTSKRNKIHPLQ